MKTVKANKCGLPTLRPHDHWFHWHASVWITHVNSFHCLGTLSAFTCLLTFNLALTQFSAHASPNSPSPHYHITYLVTSATLTICIMSDTCTCKPCWSPLLEINSCVVVCLLTYISQSADYLRVCSTLVPSVACQTTEGEYLPTNHSYLLIL